MLRFTSVRKLPKRFMFVFIASIVLCTAGSVYAESVGGPGGTWPKSWPKELETLRKKAWTWEGGLVLQRSYHIAFANRKEFESAWPHILKLKSKGAPVTLLRGPHVYVWTAKPPKSKTAGVIIRCGQSVGTVIGIELVVDGDIVNMNRIMSLPPDTPIIDKRVKDNNGK